MVAANILHADPSPQDPRVWGQKIKIQLFQNLVGNVAFQIKGNHECSNMVTNILLLYAPLPKVNLGVVEMGFMFCDL